MDALIHNQADVAAKDVHGRTPVHMASMCGHVGLLGTLLQVTQLHDKASEGRFIPYFLPLKPDIWW